MRTIVYVDGFNLYYRALKSSGPGFKWLDLWAMAKTALPAACVLERVKYFTAQVLPLPNDPDAPKRQRVYLAALRAHIANLEIVLGHFSLHSKRQKLITPGGAMDTKEITGRGRTMCAANHTVKAAEASWVADPGPPADVFNAEEKGSDVNLAVHCLNDAWAGKADCFALVTNDSDLEEVIRIVAKELGKHVVLLTPEGTKPSHALLKHASDARTIRRTTFSTSQLPSPVGAITKPPGW